MDRGIDNAALEIELDEKGVEDLRNRRNHKEEPTELAIEQVQDEDEEVQQSCAFIGNALERFWTTLGRLIKENETIVYACVYILLAVLYNAYFISCMFYYVNHDEIEMDWCDGVGFLIALTIVMYVGLFYFQVVKRFWGKAIYKAALKPMGEGYEKAWKYGLVFNTIIPFVVFLFTVIIMNLKM